MKRKNLINEESSSSSSSSSSQVTNHLDKLWGQLCELDENRALNRIKPKVNSIIVQNNSDFMPSVNLLFRALYDGLSEYTCMDIFEAIEEDRSTNHGLDINFLTKNQKEDTFFSLAMEKGYERLSEAIMLKSIKTVDEIGRTPLHLCNNHPNLAQILIDSGVHLNALDASGRTPLHYCNNPEVSQILIKAGAIPNAVDMDGYTPLHLNINIDVLRLLIQNGADVNAVNKRNVPVLHAHCSYTRDIKTIDLLIEKGANIDLVDNKGNTLLHAVCLNFLRDSNGVSGVANYILNNFEHDFEAKNHKGYTALDVISRRKQQSYAQKLFIQRLEEKVRNKPAYIFK